MITAIFEPDSAMANAYGLWQWDYGQILRIQGLYLPSMVEIHFSLQETGGTSVMRVGVTKDGVTDVVIPDSMLENGGITSSYSTYNIFAFIYLTDATSGQTEYKIKLQVKTRPKPEVPGGGEDPDIFHEAVRKVAEYADQAAESERQAEGWAHGREDLPERAEDNAKYYAGKTAKDAVQTAEDRKEVKRLVESVSGIDQQVEKVEELTKQAQGAADKAGKSEQASKDAQKLAESAKTAAETAASKTAEDRTAVDNAKAEVLKAKESVSGDRVAVESAKKEIDQLKDDIPTAVQDGIQKVNDARDAALGDISKTGTAHKTAVESAGTKAVETIIRTQTEAVGAVNTAKTKAVEAVETAETEAVKTVQTEGTTQTGNVTAEGEKQVQAVQAAAQEIVADREQIQTNKRDIADLRQSKAGAVTETVSGETIQVKDSAVAGFEGMRVFGKSTQDGVPTPENPVPIVSVGSKGNITVTIEGDTDSKSLTLATPNGLPGIPVSSEGNYTDENGQQWICDEIDLERGKYIQRVGVEKINGDWNLKVTSDIPGRFVQMKLSNSYEHNLSLCNIARWASWGVPGRDIYTFAISDHTIYFSPPKDMVMTEEELNTKLNSLSFPVVIIGKLKNLIERDLTPEEIQQYKALYTNYPTTVITNDSGAVMEVGYVADTKLYIAEKIEEPLQKQITDLQNALINQKISGGGIKVTDSARLPIKGFKVFGKSTQDGVPTPDNPVPIASVGSKGNIAVTIEGDTDPQTLILATPNGLPGIPVDSGGNYTDESGQQWVCDEIDLGRGKYVQRIGTSNLKSLTWYDYWDTIPDYHKEGTLLVFTEYFNDKTGATSSEKYFCTNFIHLKNDILKTAEIGMQAGQGGGFNIAFRVPVNIAENIEQWNEWLSQNDTVFMYILKASIERDLTPEEIAAYKALHANYPTTTVLNDENADMELTYTVDIKKYVDTQIADISRAVLARKGF